jgi:trk system potassium uptake protein TrkA
MKAHKLFTQDAIPIDVRISPEQLVCEYVEQLILYPGATQVLDFASGRVRLVGVMADRDGLLVGQRIATLKDHIPNTEGRIAAIYRQGKAMLPDGDTVIQEGDEVFFIADRKDIRVFMSEMRRLEDPVRRVVIAGGGNIGVRLALALEQTNQVKIIERDSRRARHISEQVNKAIVLVGDAADEELLLEENIDNVDVFCALTNSEEANILSSMLAKRLGSHKVMALINRASYVDLVESGSIDIAISPQQVTIGSLLAHVRRGDVVKVHSLRRGAAEAIEAIAHGSNETSKVVGRAIEDVDLPAGVAIVALVRNDQVMIAHHDTVIDSDDHVILFMTDRRKIEHLEQLFQVGVSFV